LSSRSSPGRPKRSVSRAAVRPQLLVYVEGARTEEEYIVHWSRRYRTQVRVTIADEHGVPATLVKLAVNAKRKAAREERRGGGSAWDAIWCVFDEDDHPGLHDAIARAEANGINVAVSSPCIELWFLLHFEDHTAHIERHRAQSRAQRLLGCDDKGLNDHALELLNDRYDEARPRAVALDEKHAGDGSPRRSNPSSEVWRLVEQIRAGR
jgi:hypothetical protein